MATLTAQVKQYLIITGNYWIFTLTDGALRMLIVLYFHQLGYSPLNIAMLFVFYEFFGVVTNLVGGWLGARIGLNKTMNLGLGLQIIALLMLAVPTEYLTIPLVMLAQALSGVAKDLNKMSAKSAIKLLVPNDKQDQLYHWVALLTGSKNALKGVGFFLGGLFLALFEFQGAILLMLSALTLVWLFSLVALKADLGKAQYKPKFKQIFSKSTAINTLAAARLFLFAARDIWFVIALPVYLATAFGWEHGYVGAFMACWVIGYGIVQSIAPQFTGKRQGVLPTGKTAAKWAGYLTLIPSLIALALINDFYPQAAIVIGLLVFGAIFAINSSLHSYLIIKLADSDKVSMDVGFYYMANALGRLIGTVLSGMVFQWYGLAACLGISSLLIGSAMLLSLRLRV
ncbi:MAG: putative MFS family arabinose efflux permease [Oceanospirillaceae bacterium]|jgi:predicted MFS family arabinose efflux permease